MEQGNTYIEGHSQLYLQDLEISLGYMETLFQNKNKKETITTNPDELTK